MEEKNIRDRFGSLAEPTDVDNMTEKKLLQFPEEFILRYRRNARRREEIIDEIRANSRNMPSDNSAS